MATVPPNPRQRRQHTSALIEVSADEHDGMRRKLEQPDVEQLDRLQRFLAATPSPPRA